MLVAGLLVAPSAHGDAEGSFVVDGVPGTCDPRGPGAVQDIASPPHSFTAPSDGTLVVEIRDFPGDWNISLRLFGGVVASGVRDQVSGAAPFERIRYRLAAGDEALISACNRLSPQRSILVTYRFITGDGYPLPGEVPPGFDHLAPGGPAGLKETVPVNFVFLGYDETQINTAAFLAALPRRTRPINRVRGLRYATRSYVGIDYEYDYEVIFPEDSYANGFFAALTSLGTEAFPTAYQGNYSAQALRGLDITDNVEIPAVDVEGWLAENPPPGVDTTKNTVFFINWFGTAGSPRPGFRFHVYTKAGEPDPDTGHDFGLHDQSKLIAWGGSTPDDPESGLGSLRRIWFHDLSAGPDYTTGNWAVDNLGDRLPPVWDYRTDGPREESALTGDLARVARYVAIDLLFTPSPLYPPELTPPALPASINLDLNTYEGWTGIDASEQFVEPGLVLDVVGKILPLNAVTLDEQDLGYADPRFLVCWLQYEQDLAGPGCYPERPYSSSDNLFVHHAASPALWRDDGATVDYEAGVFNYASSSALATSGGGFADDNSRDGTQSFAHVFITPRYQTAGMTGIIIHELGHHFSLSHPHDGYDYEEDRDFGPANSPVAWTGDEVDSVMSYLNVNDDFSQFDRDNRNRWMTAASITQAQVVAKLVLDASPAPAALDALHRADAGIGAAHTSFANHEYLTAYTAAWDAYHDTLAAANLAGVPIVGSTSGVSTDGLRLLIPEAAYNYAFDDPAPRAWEAGRFSRDMPPGTR